MNKLLLCGAVLASLLVASQAHADNFHMGGRLSVGVPEGATASVVATPGLDWLQLGLGGSYNYLSEGLQGSILIDPLSCKIGLTLGMDVGGFFPATIPNLSKSPTLSYSYETALLGLRFGRRNGFNFLLAGGGAHLDLNASNFSQAFTLPTGATLSNPHVSALIPAAKLQLQLLF